MKTIFFIGAGGVGKTSVQTSLIHKLTDSGIKVHSFSSVTRQFFASKGIKDEQDNLLRRESDRLQFQLELFDFYLKRLSEELDTAVKEKVEIFLADRSPIDHASYVVYNAPNEITKEQLDGLVSKVVSFIMSLAKYDHNLLVEFPVGASWQTQSVVTDNFRHAPPGKNFIISAIQWMILLNRVDFHYDQLKRIKLGLLNLELEASVKERVDTIYRMVAP